MACRREDVTVGEHAVPRVGISRLVTWMPAAYQNPIIAWEMTMMRAVFALAMLVGSPSFADGVCALPGFSENDDAVEVHLLAEPFDGAARVGIAPRVVPEGEDSARSAEFTIVEMRDGWARVENVVSFDLTQTAPPGWINGELIWFVAQTEVAFTAPDAASEVVWSGDHWPVARAVLDCDGDWALIRFDNVQLVNSDFVSLGEVTGWVRGVCMLQETTCDGTYGDRLP
jgi:predicted amino acid-binding ACT domain protein